MKTINFISATRAQACCALQAGAWVFCGVGSYDTACGLQLNGSCARWRAMRKLRDLASATKYQKIYYWIAEEAAE